MLINRASELSHALGVDLALINRDGGARRRDAGDAVVGNVTGKSVILIDDLTDTSDTLLLAAKVLAGRGGARSIYAVITHGVFSGSAVSLIQEAVEIDKLIVSNTIPQDECGKIEVYDVAPIFAEAIRRTHNGESISYLFKPEVFE